LVGEQVELLVRIPVQELNAPQSNTSRATLIETDRDQKPQEIPIKNSETSERVSGEKQKKKKRKNKKAKGIEDFMDDDKEAEAFKKEVESVVPEEKKEDKPIKEKRRKTVNFNLDQNEIKVFDKTKKIAEIKEPEEEKSSSVKKSIAQQNIDDMLTRAKSSSGKTNEEIINLSKSEIVAQALIASVQTP